MFKLISFLKPYKKECIVGPIFKLFEAILELILPTIMALLINNGVTNRDSSYVIKMGGIMLCMTIFGFCSSLVCQYYAACASQGFGTDLRNAIFKHISSLSYTEIDKFGSSSLINRITNDVNQLQIAIALLIRLVIRAPFICIGATIMAMILDFKLSLILISSTPFFALILYFFITKTSPLYKKYQKNLDELSLIIGETLRGVRVIRAFSKIYKEKKRFKEKNDDLTHTSINVGKISALLNPLTSFVMNSAIIVLLWVGAFQINSGTLLPGTIIAFVNYITQILLALIVVSNLIVLFTKASASAGRINELFETDTSIIENIGSVNENSDINTSAIEFNKVYFNYNEASDMVLENISLSINKGETVGIIGGTGSGKSTFVNLIPRFYEVNAGEILVNGINVKKYPLDTLISKISMVSQKAELFTGTIEENIRWGNLEASEDEVIEASKKAQAHEFIIKLPEGYKTKVERGGANFSGGQKQRLTIARALVKNPEILIFDDSFSALDFITDAALRKAIKDNSNNMTIIIVSQRASTIKNSDKIIVFDDGQVVALGTHRELIESSEVYKEICLSQLSSEEAIK
ncbi:ABC transporter ATP-binding protein [Clostridium uliginosum]|uniref:ATP-binding cassette, subfamily B n=1 Tax=Clostridium uliginosum TaxID=119641 RepID=A0A1I1NW79_9CLOT|nr:ABC transporter ATP-binding protein [Clostridium uliginosum]SFC97980.1 ATP-binding cassette, subfamily B [Clostridium uliginosum]